MVAGADAVAVWRPSTFARYGLVLAVLVQVGLVVAVVVATNDEGRVAVGLVAASVMCVVAAAFTAFLMRARIEATRDGIVVVTTLSTRRFAWTDISAASPGYLGITLTLRDGGSFIAGAVQKSNWSTLRGRRTRADDVAEYINRGAEQ